MAAAAEDEDIQVIPIPLIWLDANVSENEDGKNTQRKLNRNFGRCIFVTSTTNCEKAVEKSFEKTKIVLIVSGQIGSNFVPQIHDNPKYSSIYVYCGDINRHRRWADNFTKVRCFIILSVFIIISFI